MVPRERPDRMSRHVTSSSIQLHLIKSEPVSGLFQTHEFRVRYVVLGRDRQGHEQLGERCDGNVVRVAVYRQAQAIEHCHMKDPATCGLRCRTEGACAL